MGNMQAMTVEAYSVTTVHYIHKLYIILAVTKLVVSRL